MIYFDKRNLNLLKIIYRSKDGITFDAISKKVLPPELYEKEKKDGAEECKEKEQLNASIISFFNEGYIGCTNTDKAWIKLPDVIVGVTAKANFFCTEKGNEYLEKRSYGFWKWALPTIISVLALIVSVFGAIYS